MASRPLNRRFARLLLTAGALAASAPAVAEPPAIVGILQGSAVLVRQSARFALAEGAALADGDIVETPPAAFAQLEFDDGTIVGVGEATRLILKPRLTGLKMPAPPRLYLLEGWLKVNAKPDATAEFSVLSPVFDVNAKASTVVLRLQPKTYAVFAERGATRLSQRDGARANLTLKQGDFAAPVAEKLGVQPRLPPEFAKDLPRPFRDPLPARAALFAKRQITLQSLGTISYADVTAWLHSEPGVRLALSRQWQSRASDRAFRSELAANLSAHMEWERVLYPERFLPKKPKPPDARASVPGPAGEAASQPN